MNNKQELSDEQLMDALQRYKEPERYARAKNAGYASIAEYEAAHIKPEPLTGDQRRSETIIKSFFKYRDPLEQYKLVRYLGEACGMFEYTPSK